MTDIEEMRDIQIRANCESCGAGMYRVARLCGECEHREREQRQRRHEAMASWRATVPGRYSWCTGFDVPEIAERVQDAQAVAAAKATGASFDRIAFLGPAGLGKTVLAVTILRVIAEAGTRVAFVEARALAHARAQHGLGQGEAPIVRDAIHAPVAVIDDLGSEAQAPQSAVADVIHERHAHGRPTIVTCALDVAGMKARYGDGIARRVFEGAKIIKLGAGRGLRMVPTDEKPASPGTMRASA